MDCTGTGAGPPADPYPARFRLPDGADGVHAPPAGRRADPDADTASGADTGSVAVAVSDADTASGADTGSVAVAVSDADTASGADTGSVAVAVSDADTASDADTGSVAVAVSDADTATAPTGSVAVRSQTRTASGAARCRQFRLGQRQDRR